MRALSVWAALALVVGAGRVAGQTAPSIEVDGRIERAIETLAGFGLIDDRIVEMRPWTWREARRLLEQARANLTRLSGPDRAAAERVLDAVPEDRLRAVGRVEAGAIATVLGSPWVPVPEGTGGGGIDAEVSHLVLHDQGRSVLQGGTVAGEVGVQALIAGAAAVELRPRLWLARESGGDARRGIEWIDAQLRLGLGRLRIDAGRHATVWGPGRNGGSLLSDGARGLDRVSLSSDAPFRWPGLLSLMGPSMGEIFFARLEGDRDIAHSNLIGYKLAIRPHPLVEGAFAVTVESGGKGAPEASFWEHVADHLLLIDFLRNRREVEFQTSNKATATSLRIRIPPWRHTQIYGEYTIEDLAENLERLFIQDAGWLVGVWVPRLDPEGTIALRTEYHHGGIRLHRHGQFTSGRTRFRRILGMGGPDTEAVYLELSRYGARSRLSAELGFESRSADRWAPILSPEGAINVWEKVEDRPDEQVLRALGRLTLYGEADRELRVLAGVARIWDDRFVAGETRLDGILEVEARLSIGGRE